MCVSTIGKKRKGCHTEYGCSLMRQSDVTGSTWTMSMVKIQTKDWKWLRGALIYNVWFISIAPSTGGTVWSVRRWSQHVDGATRKPTDARSTCCMCDVCVSRGASGCFGVSARNRLKIRSERLLLLYLSQRRRRRKKWTFFYANDFWHAYAIRSQVFAKSIRADRSIKFSESVQSNDELVGLLRF